MNFEPLFNRVLVKPDDPEEKTPGGLFIPSTNAQAPQKGTIVAAGPGQRTEDGRFLEMTLKVGDKVVFGQYASAQVQLDGEDLLIMTETEILGKVV
jgi:chaperonin GroES